jgi:hypothetical protein
LRSQIIHAKASPTLELSHKVRESRLVVLQKIAFVDLIEEDCPFLLNIVPSRHVAELEKMERPNETRDQI